MRYLTEWLVYYLFNSLTENMAYGNYSNLSKMFQMFQKFKVYVPILVNDIVLNNLTLCNDYKIVHGPFTFI